jgi:DNA-binding MarR family transcriptional regulator
MLPSEHQSLVPIRCKLQARRCLVAQRCLLQADGEDVVDDMGTRTERELEAAERGRIAREMKEVLTSLRSLADERLAIHNISYKQGVPLRYLHWQSPCNVTELATAVGIDVGAMTRMLERLETKGLLERHRSPDDRRVVEVSLLEAGAPIAALVDDVLVSVAEDHLKDFSLAERAQLRQLLERMRVNGRANASGQSSSAKPLASSSSTSEDRKKLRRRRRA